MKTKNKEKPQPSPMTCTRCNAKVNCLTIIKENPFGGERSRTKDELCYDCIKVRREL